MLDFAPSVRSSGGNQNSKDDPGKAGERYFRRGTGTLFSLLSGRYRAGEIRALIGFASVVSAALHGAGNAFATTVQDRRMLAGEQRGSRVSQRAFLDEGGISR